MRKLFIFIILLPTVSYGQETIHPIDKALGVCTEKDPSTAGMVRCIDIAYRDWDKELNRNYQTLMSKFKPADKQTLKAAQLEWLKYRDADFKLIDSIYDKLQGTMYIPMRLDQKMQFIKHRAEALAGNLDLLAESEP